MLTLKNLTCGYIVAFGQLELGPGSCFQVCQGAQQVGNEKSSCERRTVLINRHPEARGDTLRVRVLDDLMEEGSNDEGKYRNIIVTQPWVSCKACLFCESPILLSTDLLAFSMKTPEAQQLLYCHWRLFTQFWSFSNREASHKRCFTALDCLLGCAEQRDPSVWGGGVSRLNYHHETQWLHCIWFEKTTLCRNLCPMHRICKFAFGRPSNIQTLGTLQVGVLSRPCGSGWKTTWGSHRKSHWLRRCFSSLPDRCWGCPIVG